MRRSLAALALALVLPLPALAGEVTVKTGETLSEIAERYGVSVQRLMEINAIRKADHVEVGQVLKVPGATPSKTSRARAGNDTASGRITVQEGDTLSEIADRQGMSLNQLMALNGLTKADHVEVGQVLRVKGTAAASASAAVAPSFRKGASVHVVRSGESLSEIAEGYGVSMQRLVAINAIDDPNHVEVGTRLKLKGEAPASAAPRAVAAASRPVAATPRPAAAITQAPSPSLARPRPAQPNESEATAAATPAVSAATAAAVQAAAAPTRAVETPSPRAVETPMPRPVETAIPRAAATPVSRPAAVAPRPAQTTAVAAAAAPAASASPTLASNSWRPYGPLQVDWSNWQPMGGSLVAPVMNAKGETLYLAINCGARKMNATSAAGDWRTWDDPQADFERRLVNDLCTSRG